MQWWCSAQGVSWDWTWRPYVGVWIVLGLLTWGYVALLRRHGPAGRTRVLAFAAAVGALEIALDWPVAALAAGYLASLHMVQFLVVALIAPPLLLLAVPPRAWSALAARPRPVLAALTRPVIAILGFNLLIWLTHWPPLVDRLMGSQLGSFGIDAAWFCGGVWFWWPVVSPVPARPAFVYPLKMAYLIVNTVLSTAPFVWLTFTALPIYATYELAPPIEWLGKHHDQQAAGILMKIGGGLVLWTALMVLFWRWWRDEEGPTAAG